MPAAESAKVAESIGSQNVSAAEIDKLAIVPKGWSGPANVYKDLLHGETTVNFGSKNLYVEYKVSDKDPAHASVIGTRTATRTVAGRQLEWRGRTEVTSDENAFHIHITRELLSDEKLIREKEWNESIPRDMQ